MRRRRKIETTGLPVDPMSDLWSLLMFFFILLWSWWAVTFVDTRLGDMTLKENEIVVKSEDASWLQPVRDHQLVVTRDQLAELHRRVAKERRRADDAIAEAKAFGIEGMAGGREGVVIVVDLSMDQESRVIVRRLIQQCKMNRFTLIGCGDDTICVTKKLRDANQKNRDEACELLEIWPIARDRIVLDAIEGALAIDGATAVVLFVAGPPTGGGEELLAFVKQHTNKRPVTIVDCSAGLNVGTGELYGQLATLTGGRFNIGRR